MPVANASVKSTEVGFVQESIGGQWSWNVQASNVFGGGHLFQVTDVITPYGPLLDVEVPIPADVICAMADSITDVQDQLAPLLKLVSPATSILSAVIVEGDSNLDLGDVEVQNVGAFGSFMRVTATPSVPWLTVSPSTVGGLARNEKAVIGSTLLTPTLLSSESPYQGVINLQDNRNVPTVVPVTVTVTVNPRPAIGVSPTALIFNYILSTSTPSGAQSLDVENAGPANSSLEFSVASVSNSGWLSFTPASGGPLGPGASDTVSVSLDTSGVPLTPGVYTDTVRIISGNASNSPVEVPVTLNVLP